MTDAHRVRALAFTLLCGAADTASAQALLNAPASAPVPAPAAACDYENTPGTRFVFATKDEGLQQYGYQEWTSEPYPDRGLPYAQYVGKKGKFLGTMTEAQGGIFKFHDVLLEDCERLYFHAYKEELPDADMLRLGGVRLIDRAPANWSSYVTVDKMTDEKSCIAGPASKAMPSPAFIYSRAGLEVYLIGADFPNKEVAFRVDKRPALSERGHLGNTKAHLLLDQIRAGGTTMLVRGYAWPNDYPVDKEFNLDGLIAVLDDCKSKVLPK